MSDFYEILGVTKESNENEIKKAYRELSLRFHPDRNPDPNATTKFQEISEAYETLSDPLKKQEYDHRGERNPFLHGHGHGMNDFDDINNIFNMMFANGMGPMGMGMGMGRRGARKGRGRNGLTESRAEQSRAEQSRAEQSRAEQRSAEQSGAKGID
jgi:molecular chaperone DnaJ